ncbi:aspartoacylase [Vibrio maerlii]|uniref:aspartoacylase n=1 Tax=Vibrio maerlii TaxID=2231648 RepID=UPI000E3CE864|nr:aspartoacylase [Vibrio maerlii]
MDNINQVLIVGGTHGNELSGIYLNKLIKERLYNIDRASFSASSVIANPDAVKANTRFVEQDLNRQFSLELEANSKEARLATEFKNNYCANNPLIIDLHNTTSNMGATLILLSNSPFYKKMGAYVKQRMPGSNILFEDRKEWNEQPYLCTASQYGVMIEVGAQAHGSLQFETLELMKEMLSLVLDYVDKHNLYQLSNLANYDAFYYTEEVQIPMDHDGMRIAAVHPTICGRDFEVVKTGEPIMATFFGFDIYWEKENDIYPHFINESAYSSANIAMALAEKKTVFVD